jgi:polyisoprenoid-binding protein YceI
MKAIKTVTAGFVLLLGMTLMSAQAEVIQYEIDAVHSSVDFKIRHLGISWVRGSFTEFSGQVNIDSENPEKSQVSITVQAASVDTRNKARDKHLRNEDYFNVEKLPIISFKSTSLKKQKDGTYLLTGKLTLLKTTRTITTTLTDSGEADGMHGEKRRGGELAEIVLKRSDYGMKMMIGPIGDEVTLYLAFSAVKK